MAVTDDPSSKLSSIPVSVGRVIVDGVGRTKNHVVIGSVQNVLKATNFGEMLKLSHEAKLQMEKLGVFKSVEIVVDTSKGEHLLPNSYDVMFEVTEPNRVTGGVNTLVGTNDASLSLGVSLPNTTGRGEKLNLQYTHGTRQMRAANLSFSKPVGVNPDIMFSCAASQAHGEFPWSAYKETDRMTSANFTFPSLLGVHTFKWEGVWRDLRALPTAAFAVREHSGHSIKSSIIHTVSRDSRDDQILPTTGSLLRFYQEYAGIGGDIQFEKHHVQVQLNQSLPLSTVAQVSLDAGLMTSQTGEKQRINDLYLLGGPLTLRGFTINGTGPRHEGCSLGGDTYWQCGAHIYTPLPFTPGKGGFGELFRSHLFVTAGSLINRQDQAGGPISWREALSQLNDSVRLSYGGGVVLRMGGVARLELNYVVPVLVRKGDSVCSGVQFGIGVWYS